LANEDDSEILEKAKTIIDSYNKVLEQTIHMSCGIPKSYLPYKIESIKNALKTHIRFYKKAGDIDEVNDLREAYCLLANFMDDQTALRSEEQRQKITRISGTTNQGDFITLMKESELDFSLQSTLEEIAKIKSMLKVELDDFIKTL
jgi:hypothetical protein